MTTDTIGGVWTFTIDLARQFSRSGIEVILAALGGVPTANQIAEANGVSGLCLLNRNFKLEWMEDPWNDVRKSADWLIDLDIEYRPDIVHLNTLVHGASAWSVPVVITAHSCVLSWWAAVKNKPAPDGWNRYRNVVSQSLNAADIVVSPTAAMAFTLTENYGLPVSRILVVPNGRDKDQFYSARKEPFVLTAGRLWDLAKNTAGVAQAASSLSWPVYAAGDTRHPDGGRTHFHGACLLGRLTAQELAEWMSRAKIFALPARYEPFGLSALEAGLSKCALVLGDIPSQHEVWGDAALFVSPDDGVALVAAIRSLIDYPQLRAEMSRRSYERAMAFDPANTADLYLDAYHSASCFRELQCAS